MPLIKFIKMNITCTKKVDKIMEFGLDKRTAKKVAKSVGEVNVHHHTKTCKKYNTDCRFYFPRLPSNYFIIAQESEMDDNNEDKNVLIHAVRTLLTAVKEKLPENTGKNKGKEEDSEPLKITLESILKEALPTIFIDERENTKYIVVNIGEKKLSFKLAEVCDKYHEISGEKIDESTLSEEKEGRETTLRNTLYHYALTFCDYGTKIVMQREVDEIYVNNYNPNWMEAWDGNMDIQICLDYHSVITYMTDYVTKSEKNTTDILKGVRKEKNNQNCSQKELMYSLIQTYLTHREMGECEAYYKLDQTLHLKQSNIKTIFVATGFPENRAKFLRKCHKGEDSERGFEVDDHEGKFIETETVHGKYCLRPQVVMFLCLCQFTMWYRMRKKRNIQS